MKKRPDECGKFSLTVNFVAENALAGNALMQRTGIRGHISTRLPTIIDMFLIGFDFGGRVRLPLARTAKPFEIDRGALSKRNVNKNIQ